MTAIVVPQRRILRPRLPNLAAIKRLGDPSFNRLGVRGQPWGLGRAGAAAGFLPTDFDGLELWVKGTFITGLSGGDPVATWPDESGNNRDLTQGVGALRPTWQESVAALNGQPAVRFTADRLVTPIGFDFPNFSVYAAIVPTGGATFRNIINKSSAIFDRNFYLVIRSVTDLLTIGFTDATASFNESTSVAAATDGVGAVVGGIWDGTTLISDLNGAEVSAVPGVTPQLVGANIYVGDSFTSGTEFYEQDIAEIALYSTPLDADQRSTIKNYMGDFYDVTIS